MTGNRIRLGKITTVHGVKGLVKVAIYGDRPQSLEDCGPLFTSETGADEIALTLKNPMGKIWLAAVDNVTDRTTAEKLRGTELWVDRERLPAPDEGEYYHADLVGLTALDEAGNPSGTVIAVEDFGAGPLLEIQPTGTGSFYLPFTDSYIPAVNIADGTVTVRIPEEWTKQ